MHVLAITCHIRKGDYILIAFTKVLSCDCACEYYTVCNYTLYRVLHFLGAFPQNKKMGGFSLLRYLAQNINQPNLTQINKKLIYPPSFNFAIKRYN